jgi:hypothetical protein
VPENEGSGGHGCEDRVSSASRSVWILSEKYAEKTEGSSFLLCVVGRGESSVVPRRSDMVE